MFLPKRKVLCAVMALVLCFLLPVSSLGEAAAVSVGSTRYTVSNAGFLPGLQAVVPTAGNQFLMAELVVKTAADAPEAAALQQHLLAVDEAGRPYTPLLFNGESSFTAALAPGEKAFRVIFEVPKASASYRLLILSAPGGDAAGAIPLGKSIGPVRADGEPLAVIEAQGFGAVIHGVSQSTTAYLDTAPEGMKYVWLDATITGLETQASVSEIAGQFTLPGAQAVVPARAVNMLSLANARFGEMLPFVRGQICFLVPEGWTQLEGLSVGTVTVEQPLPLAGSLEAPSPAKPDDAGAYQQAGWKITVHHIRLAETGALNAPPAGNKYVIANLTVENKSTQNLTVSSELAFAMTDDKGNELIQEWFADPSDMLDAVLLPTESVTGEVAFLLPDGAAPGMLRVHLSMLGEPLLIDAASHLAK